jgi:phosphoserine phosphatase
MIKAFLFDFDGTIVTHDLLAVISEIVGKKDESLQLDKDFWTGVRPGLLGLIERINLLKGVTKTQIATKLADNNYLMPGAKELFRYLQTKNIVTIIGSGNIMPILEYYQQVLGFDYIIGSQPHLVNDTITGISESDFPHSDYKLTESQKILENLRILPEETIAIGDTPGDKSRFLFAGYSIAINPKAGIEKFATYTIENDLTQVIPIIEAINNKVNQ